MLPASFVNAVQLRLRFPLSLLAGITTCKCGCAMGPFGDHVLSCPSCLCDRTPAAGHDLVVDVVASLARHASEHVSYSSRCPRDASLAYSPNWCPDITLISSKGPYLILPIANRGMTPVAQVGFT